MLRRGSGFGNKICNNINDIDVGGIGLGLGMGLAIGLSVDR